MWKNVSARKEVNVDLLPAALLSEKPLALVVANIIISEDAGAAPAAPEATAPEAAVPPELFQSDVHGQSIDLRKFKEFVVGRHSEDDPSGKVDSRFV